MWKEYLYFTKKERNAAITLIILILFIPLYYLFFQNREEPTTNENETQTLAEFQKEIKSIESSLKYKARKGYSHYEFKKNPSIQTALFPFDPNTADSITFLRLGLKPFMAKAILKYRKMGGKYRKPEDFSKVPFIDKTLLANLIPYIQIDEKYALRKDTIVKKATPFIKQEKIQEGTYIDLATADTSELKKIPGIGSAIAKMIISYRNRLGGFYTINQLKELKFLNEETFLKISKFTHISAINISRISVNRCSFERLSSHPYLNFYQAKAIIELRKKKGKLKSLEEFKLYDEFAEKDFERLFNYLDFN